MRPGRRRVRLVVGESAQGPAADPLLVLADGLADHPDLDLDVLVWLAAARSREVAARGPSVDAGAIDRRLLPRALQRLRQPRLAQAVKTPHLRRLLAELDEIDVLVLGDLSVVPCLAWMPTPPAMVAVVGDHDLSDALATDPRVTQALATADVVVATGPAAADWVLHRGVLPDRVARHGLMDTAPPNARTASTGPLDLVGLAHFGADEVGPVLSGIVAELPTRPLAFRWYGEAEGNWSLWQGTDGLVTHRVETAAPLALPTDLADLRAVVHPVAAPLADDVRRRARLLGVPVVPIGSEVSPGSALGAALDAERPETSWTLTAAEAAEDLSRRLAADDDSAGDEGPPGAG